MENLTAQNDVASRHRARALYWQGWRVARIAETLNEKAPTVHSWKRRDKWDDAKPIDRVEATLEARLIQLINKEVKDGKDFKEIDLLGRQIERVARVNKYHASGKESDLNPNIDKRNAGEKAKPSVNALTNEHIQDLEAAFLDSLFDYQKGWHEAKHLYRSRNILKSRQIGATWYFSREAFVDALKTGRNKVFVSASKAQAHIFKNYILQFCKDVTGVQLRGDPIVLPNGANLYFLGTNAKTAQGYHGDIYVDEYFWVCNFLEFRKVVSGMAMHKTWQKTYFSTPSSITHQAYGFWSGDLFNKRRKKADKLTIDISHEALKNGNFCEDRQWRQIVTVEDAINGGCDLFDLDELRLEYSDDEYNNLLMCEFMDDSHAVFPLQKMLSCCVDSWVDWRDLKPFSERPLGQKEVWIGYDPAGDGEDGDGAGLVVVAPAQSANEAHRIVVAEKLYGKDYEQQAKAILDLCKIYNVKFVGIDVTGLGEAVAQLVENEFLNVVRFRYSPEVKARLVLQAQHIIDKKRLQFDAGRSDIAAAFMSVRKMLTPNGKHITYSSGRSATTGHGELAWATMHALSNEPLTGPCAGANKSILEIYS